MLLAAAVVFSMVFSYDGKGVPGTINETLFRALCFPDSDALYELERIKKLARTDSTAFYSLERIKRLNLPNRDAVLSSEETRRALDKIDTSTGAKWLEKGTKVKVIKTVQVPTWTYFSLVETIDEPRITCVVSLGDLNMGVLEWIKWKWNAR